MVAQWYLGRGYQVVERNWRCPGGEVDLVLVHEGSSTLVFCEVKTRTSSAFGSPFEAVTPLRLRRLRRLAGRYLEEGRPNAPVVRAVRIDVAAVRPGRRGVPVVEVLEGAGA